MLNLTALIPQKNHCFLLQQCNKGVNTVWQFLKCWKRAQGIHGAFFGVDSVFSVIFQIQIKRKLRPSVLEG